MAYAQVMASRDFIMQLQGYGLTTVEVHYFMPDHPSLLQMFAFQQYDVAPKFPVLRISSTSGGATSRRRCIGADCRPTSDRPQRMARG